MLKSTTRIQKRRTRTAAQAIQPRKTPSQRRSTETVRAILEASARILESKGMGSFNTNAVAERAGVSIGSLYQFFPGKDAILAALIEQHESAMLAHFEESFQSIRNAPFETCLNVLSQTMVQAHRKRPKLYQLLEAEESRLLQGVEQSPLAQRLHTLLTCMLRKHRAELTTRNINEAAHDVIWIARAIVHGALARGETRWPAIERRLLRAVKGYLCA